MPLAPTCLPFRVGNCRQLFCHWHWLDRFPKAAIRRRRNATVAQTPEDEESSNQPHAHEDAVAIREPHSPIKFIPLQHRIGNGYVFCDEYISEDEACSKLLGRLDGPALRDPKVLRFVTGRRRKTWVKNVVALGLASGFLEPLESTSIHLAQVGLTKLLTYMPRDHVIPAVCELYNEEMRFEYEHIKDFLVAHYNVTEREDTAFWRYCKNMQVPATLKSRLDLFKATANVNHKKHDLFQDISWIAVLNGQGFVPDDYHPMADVLPADDLKLRMAQMRTKIQDRLQKLTGHDDFLREVQQSTSMSVV
jgi:tryptophan 7-halogenase